MEETYVDRIKQGSTVYPIKDTTSGYITTADHGTIAEGDTGYVNGDDIYNALASIESQLSEI